MTWIATHPYAAGAVAVLALYAIVCAYLLGAALRSRFCREPDTSPESGAPEGANPAVGMPRFK